MAPTRPNTLRRRPLAVGPPLAAVGAAAAAALMTDTGAAAWADPGCGAAGRPRRRVIGGSAHRGGRKVRSRGRRRA